MSRAAQPAQRTRRRRQVDGRGDGDVRVPEVLGEGRRRRVDQAPRGDQEHELGDVADLDVGSNDRPPARRGARAAGLCDLRWIVWRTTYVDVGQVLQRNLVPAGQRMVDGHHHHARIPFREQGSDLDVRLVQRQAGHGQVDLTPTQRPQSIGERNGDQPDRPAGMQGLKRLIARFRIAPPDAALSSPTVSRPGPALRSRARSTTSSTLASAGGQFPAQRRPRLRQRLHGWSGQRAEGRPVCAPGRARSGSPATT